MGLTFEIIKGTCINCDNCNQCRKDKHKFECLIEPLPPPGIRFSSDEPEEYPDEGDRLRQLEREMDRNGMLVPMAIRLGLRQFENDKDN
jgi:hypothetical protein